MFTFGFSSFVKFVLRLFSTSEIINKNRKKKINGTVRHQASFLPVVKGVFLSVNPKTDFRSKNGFRVPFGKSKSGFLIW